MSFDTSPFCVSARVKLLYALRCYGTRFLRPKKFLGRVGEWLKPADCKSAAPCGLRRFESFPVHQAPGVQPWSFAALVCKPQGNRMKRCSAAAKLRRKRRQGKVRRVAGSLGRVSRGPLLVGMGLAWVAQLVERVLGKDEVTGSIPVPGSRFRTLQLREEFSLRRRVCFTGRG